MPLFCAKLCEAILPERLPFKVPCVFLLGLRAYRATLVQVVGTHTAGKETTQETMAPAEPYTRLQRMWNFCDALDIFVALVTLSLLLSYLWFSGTIQLDGMVDWQPAAMMAGVVDKAAAVRGDMESAVEAVGVQGAAVMASGLAVGAQGLAAMAAGLSVVNMGWVALTNSVGMMVDWGTKGANIAHRCSNWGMQGIDWGMKGIDDMTSWGMHYSGVEDAQGAPPNFVGML